MAAGLTRALLLVRLVRPVNVVLIALTVPALWSVFVQPLPVLHELDIGSALLLGLALALVAAGGNVVNDIADRTIDRLNERPNPLNAGLPVGWAWWAYLATLIGAAAITVHLAHELTAWSRVLLLPLACAGLAAYAFRLKCVPLLGNLTVATFCAGVPGILFLAEPTLLGGYLDTVQTHSLLAYVVLAFAATLGRELIKDLEDREGDRAAGCRPLAVTRPEGQVVWAARGSLYVSLAAVAYLATLWYIDGALVPALSFAALWLLMASVTAGLRDAQAKSVYSGVSQYLKLAIAFGLLLLIFAGSSVRVAGGSL